MWKKTPKGCPYVSPGWSDESKTNVAQSWVTRNALTENPEGVILKGVWVDSSILYVSPVNLNSMPTIDFEEFVLSP